MPFGGGALLLGGPGSQGPRGGVCVRARPVWALCAACGPGVAAGEPSGLARTSAGALESQRGPRPSRRSRSRLARPPLACARCTSCAETGAYFCVSRAAAPTSLRLTPAPSASTAPPSAACPQPLHGQQRSSNAPRPRSRTASALPCAGPVPTRRRPGASAATRRPLRLQPPPALPRLAARSLFHGRPLSAASPGLRFICQGRAARRRERRAVAGHLASLARFSLPQPALPPAPHNLFSPCGTPWGRAAARRPIQPSTRPPPPCLLRWRRRVYWCLVSPPLMRCEPEPTHHPLHAPAATLYAPVYPQSVRPAGPVRKSAPAPHSRLGQWSAKGTPGGT